MLIGNNKVWFATYEKKMWTIKETTNHWIATTIYDLQHIGTLKNNEAPKRLKWHK